MIRMRWTPRVTVAAIVERDGRFLLVEEHTPDGLRLNNPAGHLEPGESLLQAAVRECLEETGRDFEPQAVVGVYLARLGPARAAAAADVTYLRVAVTGRVGEPRPECGLDRGIVRTLWLGAEALRACRARHRSPLVQTGIDDYLAGQRFPLSLLGTDPSVWGAAPPR
jgi:8-oxo-dGTP pyrophosphatase MutT (NUDIX family)